MFNAAQVDELVLNHLSELPAIRYLDDYIHWEEQLKSLRTQNDGEFRSQVFATELALLFRLQEYDERVGLPLTEMPETGGSSALLK